MLLSLLTRKEKLKFLDLAMHMVTVDGEASEIEKRLLQTMLVEVGDDIANEYTFKLSADLKETIEFFSEASVAVKNIVYLNLIKTSMIDELYNTAEHFFLEDIREHFNIDDYKKKQIIRLVYNERDLRERAKRIVTS
ncbi:MAG: hypothetical protein AB7E61_04575 [Acholeplasmataceae bacterium]